MLDERFYGFSERILWSWRFGGVYGVLKVLKEELADSKKVLGTLKTFYRSA